MNESVRRGQELAIGGKRGGAAIGGMAASAALISLAAQLTAERALGVSGFGQWSYLNSMLVLFAPIACLGANHILLSQKLSSVLVGRSGTKLLSSYFAIMTLLAFLAMLLTLLVERPREIQLLSVVALCAVFFFQVPTNVVYPLFQRNALIAWVAVWPLAQVSIRLLVAVLTLVLSLGVAGSFVAWAIGAFLLAVLALVQIGRLGLAYRPSAAAVPAAGRPGRAAWRDLASAGALFGLGDLSDSVDIKLVVPIAVWVAAATGVSLAAAGLTYVLLSAIHYFPYVLVIRVLLPAVHDDSAAVRARVVALVRRICGLVLAVLVPAAAIFYGYGFAAIAAVVHGDYAEQAVALSLLGVAAIPLFLSQLLIAPFLGLARVSSVIRWRVESVLLFVVIAFAGRAQGLTAVVIAFALGRTWLCLRAWRALPAVTAGSSP